MTGTGRSARTSADGRTVTRAEALPVIANPQGEAIQDLYAPGLLHCVRNDEVCVRHQQRTLPAWQRRSIPSSLRRCSLKQSGLTSQYAECSLKYRRNIKSVPVRLQLLHTYR
jgi:hypothetical protein